MIDTIPKGGNCMKKKKVKISGWTVLKFIFLVICAAFFIYPLWMVFINSFRTNVEIMMDPFGMPKAIHLENYAKAWFNGKLGTLVGNSIFVTFVADFLVVLFSSVLGFVMTRRDFKYRKPLFILFVIGMTIPFQVGIIPLFLQMSKMGMTDSRLGLIIVYVVNYLSYSTYLMYGFMRKIPNEIQEAALIDGATTMGLYRYIMMPLSRSIVTTVGIFNMMYFWNDMFFSLVMLQDKAKKTLQIGLLAFRGQYMSDYATMFAGVVLVSLPMIVVFFALQKRFIEGVAAGAVKG